MKKLFILMSLIVQLFGVSDLEYDTAIQNEKNPLVKQTLKCEKEATNHKDYGNPQICIDSANLYEAKKTLSNNEKSDYGEAYNNAGIMYTFGKNNKDYIQAYKMFLKAYNIGYRESHPDVMVKLGYFNDNGKGTKQNKILAYKYYFEAAKLGNIPAQNNLDILCKESSWACK